VQLDCRRIGREEEDVWMADRSREWWEERREFAQLYRKGKAVDTKC